MTSIYLDVCCLNRPFNDQTQDRIRLEAAAVLTTLEQVSHGQLLLITSDLQKLGFHFFDALHIACAESAGADVLLTTDDRLLRLALRVRTELTVTVRVANPADWLMEIIDGNGRNDG